MVRFPGFQHEDSLLKHLSQGVDPEPFSITMNSSNNNSHEYDCTNRISIMSSSTTPTTTTIINDSYPQQPQPTTNIMKTGSSTCHAQSGGPTTLLQSSRTSMTMVPPPPTPHHHHQVPIASVMLGASTTIAGASTNNNVAGSNNHPQLLLPTYYHHHLPTPSTISSPVVTSSTGTLTAIKQQSQSQQGKDCTTTSVQEQILNQLCNGMNAKGIPSGYIPSPPPAQVRAGQWTVEQPSPQDVLCGRGSKVNNHIGNIHFRSLIAQWKDLYLHTERKKIEKAHICAYLVNHVRTTLGGRFLKMMDETKQTLNSSSGRWIEIGDVKARKKAGQALREDATELRRETSNHFMLQDAIERQQQQQQQQKQQQQQQHHQNHSQQQQKSIQQQQPQYQHQQQQQQHQVMNHQRFLMTSEPTTSTNQPPLKSATGMACNMNRVSHHQDVIRHSTASALTESEFMRASVASFQMSCTDHEAATMDFSEFLRDSDREIMLLSNNSPNREVSSPSGSSDNNDHRPHKKQHDDDVANNSNNNEHAAVIPQPHGKPLSALRQQHAMYLAQHHQHIPHKDDTLSLSYPDPETPLRTNLSVRKQMTLCHPGLRVASLSSPHEKEQELPPLSQLPLNASSTIIPMKKLERDISDMSFQDSKNSDNDDEDDDEDDCDNTHEQSMMQESMVGSFHIATSSLNYGLSGIDFAQFMKPCDREELFHNKRKEMMNPKQEEEEHEEESARAAFERAKTHSRRRALKRSSFGEQQVNKVSICSVKDSTTSSNEHETSANDAETTIEQLSSQLMSAASIENDHSTMKSILALASAQVRAKHLS